MTITVFTADGDEGSLGSDKPTTIEDSSAGPGVAFVGDVLDTAVSWFATSDGLPDSDDPVLAHNLDAGFGRAVKDRVDTVEHDPDPDAPDYLTFAYTERVGARRRDRLLPLLRVHADQRRRRRRSRAASSTPIRPRSSRA